MERTGNIHKQNSQNGGEQFNKSWTKWNVYSDASVAANTVYHNVCGDDCGGGRWQPCGDMDCHGPQADADIHELLPGQSGGCGHADIAV